MFSSNREMRGDARERIFRSFLRAPVVGAVVITAFATAPLPIGMLLGAEYMQHPAAVAGYLARAANAGAVAGLTWATVQWVLSRWRWIDAKSAKITCMMAAAGVYGTLHAKYQLLLVRPAHISVWLFLVAWIATISSVALYRRVLRGRVIRHSN